MEQGTVRPAATTSPQPAWDIALLFPPQGQWSEADYFWLDANRESKRLMEFSDGAIEVLDMPSPYHQAIILFIIKVLQEFVLAQDLGVVSFAGLRVKLKNEKFREPDIVFMRKENDARRGKEYWEGADVVMEVVSTNREHDLVKKRKEYAEAGIPEYWIVDPEMRTITVLTLERNRYAVHSICAQGAIAQSVLLPGFEVAVDDVFNQ